MTSNCYITFIGNVRFRTLSTLARWRHCRALSLALAGLSCWSTIDRLRDRTLLGRECVRVRSKLGFGYGAETDITYGFGLVSATAKMQWHKFGFGRNITPKCRNRRNCKIGTNCRPNTGSLAVRLLAVGKQDGACASWYRRPET